MPESNEAEELAAFENAVLDVRTSADFLVIDTPSTDTYLMRLAHLIADTLLTPVADSFLDLGTLALTDPITHEVIAPGHYAELVCDARRRRREFDESRTDWVVIRNRSARGESVQHSIAELGTRLGLRDVKGCAERMVYRRLFPSGLTALDVLDEPTFGATAGRSHRLARREMHDLIDHLNLPISERARRRATAREEWFAASRTPLDVGDVLGE